MPSIDSINRKVCHDLFNALEEGDIGAVRKLYADDMVMWVNLTGQEMSAEDNLAAVEAGKGLHRRRNYNDRQIHTFEDGFVAQYTCEVVAKNGMKVPLSSCLVARVHNGKIVRLDEYMDSSKFPKVPAVGETV